MVYNTKIHEFLQGKMDKYSYINIYSTNGNVEN